MKDKGTRETPDAELLHRMTGLLCSKLRHRGLAICLSGIDGSGKTTLARDLVRVLEASSIPVRHLHLHQWYRNISITPVLLLYNKYFERKVLVFDRNIYDNTAVFSIRRSWLRRATSAALVLTRACYPKFDYRFYLMVSFGEALRRRPDTYKERFVPLTEVYDEIVSRGRYSRFVSDEHLFDSVLREIADEG